MSSNGDKSGALGLNFIGIVVFMHGENEKLAMSFAIPILDCMTPNLKPVNIQSIVLVCFKNITSFLT
jgi:hypothetical protein